MANHDAAPGPSPAWRSLVSDRAHPPRASNVEELRQLQKAARAWDAVVEGQRVESLSETLRSRARGAGPRVIRGEQSPYHPSSPRMMDHSSGASGFAKAMSDAGLRPVVVYHNLSPAELYEKALQQEPSSHIVERGALATVSGAKTGRTPGDKRIVREPASEGDVWWGEGSTNYEMDERTFALNRERAVDFLNQLGKLYVCDGYACWDAGARVRVRVVCARPSHALQAHNMLIRPSEEELSNFGRPDFTIYNAGAFPANRYTSYMTSSTSLDISFARREMVILGSQYGGCMKQGIFTLVNYWLPQRDVLPLNAGCNVGPADNVAIFFGLSGTGKTTMSSDPRRWMIGDDELGWGPNGVFNIEGGCYAKVIGLDKEREPLIHRAVRFGAVLENVCFDEETRDVDWDSNRITENTRASYPIEHMANAQVPCVGGHPRNAVLLCCDTFGLLPPVCKLTPEQALYYFVSGFTAKVAGTEMGVTAPQATFTPCYTASSLVYHPMRYAALLSQRLQQHGTQVWLVNTGWTAGGYGQGSRIPLEVTWAVVDAIHSGDLAAAPCATLPLFGLQVPTECSGVPPELLSVQGSWADGGAYMAALRRLAGLFVDNFSKFADGGGHMSPRQVQQLIAAGPSL
ncbi:phosphoenolpyruvate carboxykinase [ATP]-like [Micractinium conductrix]|uniref:phosphoenolpyruvate carboxykinase (ATP) n=1 Tax=Micractinium conductrix TaxID=554055 RepID=A0A2P6VB86_9CHLO|nr:phosphoenolpyruvate carboxykinase [ATP]-like [Micractinium conductrix]|eukprot:PSC71338.1 phosphoenolpyruvate carboxykinase [ATP]-like [Micractinium conductrix]